MHYDEDNLISNLRYERILPTPPPHVHPAARADERRRGILDDARHDERRRCRGVEVAGPFEVVVMGVAEIEEEGERCGLELGDGK